MPLPSPQLELWLDTTIYSGDHGRLQSILDQLHAVQVQCIKATPAAPQPVLLPFDHATDFNQLKALIVELQEKECRIFLLNTGDSSLPLFRNWELLNLGVEEVFWQGDNGYLSKVLPAKLARWSYIDRLLQEKNIKSRIIGNSPVWKRTLREIIEVACFSSVPVLILGESGTGKELISRLIHDLDKRPDKQELVLLDCTTIVPELSGSEFFGHEKGAFTGAIANRDGAFAMANRGTLFLDEIGELPLLLQAELLRVIQEGLYKRVGSNQWQETGFRLVSATNRDLFTEVETGKFRQDLYYRIQTCVIRLPALRERKTDIPALAYNFLKQEMRSENPPPFSPEMEDYLMMRSYPGNIRELKQLIARIAYRHCSDAPITLGDIPLSERPRLELAEHDWQKNGFRDAIGTAIANGVGFKDIKRIAGDVAMDLAIEKADGNLQDAARSLGVSDRLLQGYWANLKP